MDDGEVHPARLVAAIIIYRLETLGHTHNTTSCLAPAPPPPLIYSANTHSHEDTLSTLFMEKLVCVCVCVCVRVCVSATIHEGKSSNLSPCQKHINSFTSLHNPLITSTF
ncbi:hypothetical protein CHARACLAT_009173 [Characodon lateralis]|uniref:Uncharacterized protein n=1 Tax=Characodon lateralis TaxID=208331 RepID=A0ABU7D776_9TELE|nr:hypothetical protein [Characodon lateralis]